jgi:hypothetical protein
LSLDGFFELLVPPRADRRRTRRNGTLLESAALLSYLYLPEP